MWDTSWAMWELSGNTTLCTHFTASSTNIHCEVSLLQYCSLQLRKELWLSEIITFGCSNYNTFLDPFCLWLKTMPEWFYVKNFKTQVWFFKKVIKAQYNWMLKNLYLAWKSQYSTRNKMTTDSKRFWTNLISENFQQNQKYRDDYFFQFYDYYLTYFRFVFLELCFLGNRAFRKRNTESYFTQ